MITKVNRKKQYHLNNFPQIGGLLISAKVVDEGYSPLFIYREKGDNKVDSGWRIFSGLESDEYLEDSRNFAFYNYTTLCKRHKSVLNLLLSGIGSVYERENDESEWYEVNDFKLEDDYQKRVEIDDNWEIELNNLFLREEEEDRTLYFTTGDKSIRIKSWQLEEPKGNILKELEIFTRKRSKLEDKNLKKYDFSDEREYIIGYKMVEESDHKEFEVIYGQNILDNHVLQSAFYFDDPADEKWALDTWKTIKFKNK